MTGWVATKEETAVADDIVLTIDDERPAGAAHFFSAGGHLLELIDDLAETVDVEWTVTDLRIGSAISGLSAAGKHRQQGFAAARSAVRGLVLVRSGESLPTEWTPDAVSHAKDLVRSSGGHAKLEADGNVVWLDQQLRERLGRYTVGARVLWVGARPADRRECDAGQQGLDQTARRRPGGACGLSLGTGRVDA